MRTSLCLLVLAVVLTGCGSPDGVATESQNSGGPTESQDGGDLQSFCDQNELLDGLSRPPEDDDLDRLLEPAPADVRGDVEVLVQSAKDFRQDPDMSASDSAQAAGENLDAYVEENCEEA